MQRQLDPLPHSLTEPPSNPVLVEDVYTSTSKDHHRPQPMGTLLDHPVHKKAPGHWGVHYNWQMASKVRRNPLLPTATFYHSQDAAGELELLLSVLGIHTTH